VKRLKILFFLIFFSLFECFSQKRELDSLDYYISRQSYYDLQKEERIKEIKKHLTSTVHDPLLLYSLNLDLFNEYRCYIYDSAYVYVKKLIDISNELSDNEKIISSKIKLGFCYLSSGLFKEAFDVFNSINVEQCSNQTKIDYYLNKSRLYYDLADYNNNLEFRHLYIKNGNNLIDSAIVLLPYNSSQYWATLGLKFMKSNKYSDAIIAFKRMIDLKDYSEHDLAIATSSIAYILSLQGNKTAAKDYLIQAAISDIKSSIKETVAIRNLAQILFEEGDIDHAINYIRQALNDALFYNARHRQLEIGNILPIIENEKINIIEEQRNKLTIFLISISVLSLLLLVALFVIWKSFKRLSLAKQIIQETNDKLIEANKIKNEYIGYFFTQNAEYIAKLGSFQRWIINKVNTKQYADIKNFPKQINVEKEREALFERFDKIFLNLFPNFVEEFNKLLKPEEQIHLQKDELLNPEMRIYALIRLGIDDNEKIAHFLDYSINTIYAYKTKVKNKTLYSSKEFKQKILEIKSY